MKAYYLIQGVNIYPIYGASNMKEAQGFAGKSFGEIVGTESELYMRPGTGRVDFADNWKSLDGLIKVKYSYNLENWVKV